MLIPHTCPCFATKLARIGMSSSPKVCSPTFESCLCRCGGEVDEAMWLGSCLPHPAKDTPTNSRIEPSHKSSSERPLDAFQLCSPRRHQQANHTHLKKLEIQPASESHSQDSVASSPIFVPRHAKLQEPDEGAKPSNPGRHDADCIFSIGHSMEPKNIQSSENGARKILPNLESTWQPGVGFPTTWSSPCLHDGLQKPNRKMPSNYGWTTQYQILHSYLHATQVKLGPPKDHRADTILVGAREFSEHHASNLFSRLIHDAETHFDQQSRKSQSKDPSACLKSLQPGHSL